MNAMRTPPEATRYLDVRAAASYLSLSRYTLYEWAAAKRIPCLRVGRKLLFDRSDLDTWLAAMKKPVGARRRAPTTRKRA